MQGIAMLNPQRWASGNAGSSYSRGTKDDLPDQPEEEEDEKVDKNEKDEDAVFAIGDEDEDEVTNEKRSNIGAKTHTSTNSTTDSGKFELLLSLDVALELIHASRESLTRADTFSGYPGHYGHRVHDTIEEIFVLLLQGLGERHVTPGFGQAARQMLEWRPAEHEGTSVAPLLQFFELVHIGDTIQSMVQVYFDKEMARLQFCLFAQY